MNRPGPFHLRWRGQISGPYSQQEILQKLDEHDIGLWHEIGHEGGWMTLGEFLEQQKREREAAARSLPEDKPRAAAKSQLMRVDLPSAGTRGGDAGARALSLDPRPARSIKWFVLLGALLGFTGAHNFYAGYRGTAIAQLALAGLTLALGFGFFISWLWALVELLIVHTDARGVRMR
jgi:hypothetical protein